ncbi:Ribosome-releasing factor 2, mitochondrial [Eumeta japonica]|uniref:Ribosome-releasing factor 2, mitochondrial n=1 Tax=Eumeta variegata TaxID=151549 RepID=A0A4C1V218_EUMVA|nr:Ribosome-releasing factor 2, mitochondrial [Eumeta japonica]
MYELSVKCLLYTYCHVLFAPSTRGLQEMVNKLDDSVKKRDMKENVGKTKVMVFERGQSKTTTTERMLYYSGTIKTMGEVHHGNTVTDYMEQERQRGITITSAAVSFPWSGYQFNLIDTPGHIDFTMEVEQSLAVLDGAVIVLDGSAGVEAQTLTVWRQADGYRVPRILYLNKMDRADADEDACITSIEDKLQVPTLLLHKPIKMEGRLVGLIDLVELEEMIWTHGRGQHFRKRKLSEKEDGDMWEKSNLLHQDLVDKLSSMDDVLAETIIRQESLENLDPKEINGAIRRCTIDMKAYPVLCDLCARAFKVQHDDQKSVLTYFRLYSGDITKGQRIYNLAQSNSEQSSQLYVAYADEYQTVEKVTAGNIAVVSGLKSTMTGDLVTSTQSAANRAKTRLVEALDSKEAVEKLTLPSAKQRLNSLEEEPTKNEVADILLGIGTTIPDPVFLCSIEPPSAAFQTPLENALAELQREDPSLRVTTNDETAQIVLSGMGELHLEIIKERIIREYKIDVELGPLQIAYRESLVKPAKCTHNFDRKIGNTKQTVTVTMSAKSVKGLAPDKILKLDQTSESAANLAHLRPRHMAAVKQGVSTALLHGPKLGCPLVDVQVTLHWLEIGRGTSDSVVSAAVAQCLRKYRHNPNKCSVKLQARAQTSGWPRGVLLTYASAVLRGSVRHFCVFEEAEAMLLEPVMFLEVVSPESHSARIMSDLHRRRAQLSHVYLRGQHKVVECEAPLSDLVGYSSSLRSLSSGLATFTMEFRCYRQMAPQDEQAAIAAITGF